MILKVSLAYVTFCKYKYKLWGNKYVFGMWENSDSSFRYENFCSDICYHYIDKDNFSIEITTIVGFFLIN